MSDVAVVGAGYVGLTTAACLASLGHHVVGADVDAGKVAKLNAGEVPILEEDLPELVADGLRSGRLSFVVGAATAAADAEVVFLCVPTPQGADGAADLSMVEDVAREIAPVLRPGAVVVNKSTVPVGSTVRVGRVLDAAGADPSVAVVSNPEFLREGHAVRDFLEPSRVVIGCDDLEAAGKVAALYRGVYAPVIVADPASAEMMKYASNAFLATKISFANALANLCEAVGADVRQVARGMGLDPRIGAEFLAAGPGYGGSCFPKDTAALLHTATNAGYDFSLLQGVVAVNVAQHERIVEKVRVGVGGTLRGTTIAVLGLTFKAGTDDLRDSPALVIARGLLDQGASVRAYDPAAREAASAHLPELELGVDEYDACRGADAVALLTEWPQFRRLDFARIAAGMTGPRALIDARNLLDPGVMRGHGFAYQGVGTP